MLVQPTEDEGALQKDHLEHNLTPHSFLTPSEATVDPHSDPSPRPSPSTTILDSILEIFWWIMRSSQGNSTLEGTDQEAQEASQTCYHTPQSMDEECLIEAKIGRKEILKEKLDAKGIPEDTLDYIETEDAQDLGRTRDEVDEEKENVEDVFSTEDVLSTAQQKEKDSTDRTDEGTDDQTEGGRATQTTQTPTSTIFGDDETIAQVLLNMSQAKAVSREKEKGIDAKRQRKKKIKRGQIFLKVNQMELPEGCEEERKRLAEEEATNDALIRNYDDIKHEVKRSSIQNLKTKKFEEIQALYEKIKRSDEDFISIGSAEDERLIKEMNEKGIDSSKNESVKEEDKEEEGTKKRKSGHIKMIARKKKRSQSDVDSDDEHKKCLKIITFESILDSEIMEKKSVILQD
ncbi:hypothetical protein Tco_0199527 [Tanacetum coccineum]